MADLYDILNSGILDNYKPGAQLKINKPGISASIPNYNLNKLWNIGGTAMKGAGIASTAIPFYKDIAFPIADDMYKAIKGDTNSRILQTALKIANANQNANSSQNDKSNKSVIDNGLTPVPELDEKGKSNLLGNAPQAKSNSVRKLQQQEVANTVANEVTDAVAQQNPNVSNQQLDDKEDLVRRYVELLQSTKQPYIKALEKYLSNYNKNLDQARRADLYFYAANLADGLDPRAGQKFNPLQNQADIINVIKLIGDAKAGDIEAINELKGNIALANEMDLPEQAAFGNKNLLTALSQAKRYATDLEKARINDAMRRYGYDLGYLRALDTQALRNQGNIAVANTYANGGAPGLGLTSQGTAQVTQPQQSYNPVTQRQSEEQDFYRQVLGY